MTRRSRPETDGATPFQRRPDVTPPSKLARVLGASDPAGAETTIVNFLADLGPDEVTPELVRAVFEQYSVPDDRRDNIIYGILRSTIDRHVERGALTGDGKELIPRLAVALGIPADDIGKVTSSVIRSRKRVQEKHSSARSQSAPSSGKAASDNATLLCPKCGSPHVAIGNQGYGLGKAAAGFVVGGPVGLLGGLLGSKKVVVGCASCGHRWAPEPG